MGVTRSDADVGPADPAGSVGSRKTYDAFISYAHGDDGGFAAALQRGLQHLAKPWNRRRAMEVFRDETSLPASAGLLPSIRSALDASRWFVLLASPEASRSAWVGREIAHWVSAKGADHVLVVVTDGTWAWDHDAGDLSPDATAASPALRGVFAAEPRYLDMTWARRDAGLTLHNAQFRDQVATLAAAIREVPKEEIEGEDVRLQRRTRRLVRTVIAVLTVLVVLASVLAVSFNVERLQAISQRNAADSGKLISESQNVSTADPALSILLSIAAWRLDPSPDARHAMLVAATHTAVPTGILDVGLPGAVAFSPDGKILAVGDGNTVRLFDVATRSEIGGPLTGHHGTVVSVRFSPDGRILASGSIDRSVRLWDVATRREIGGPLAGFSAGVLVVAFSPDGKILAGGSYDGTVRLWDVASRREIGGPLANNGNGVYTLAYSPDGKILAVGGSDGTVQLWNAATGNEIGDPLAAVVISDASANAPTEVDSLAFSPDGKILATGGAGGELRLWDVATGRQMGIPLTGHTATVTSLAFSPDGSTLATGSNDYTVRLWDVATHLQIGAPLTAHTAEVSSVAFSPDGTTLASAGLDGTVRLWHVATGRVIGSPGGTDTVNAVAFGRGGTLLAGAIGNLVRLWNARTGRPAGTPLAGHTDMVDSMAFSPDGKLLATGSLDGAVQVWDVATGRRIRDFYANLAAVWNDTGAVWSVAFSPDGKLLATASGNAVQLWDVATGRQAGRPLAGDAGAVDAVAFSPDGKIMATGSNDNNTVRLWDVATGREIGRPLTGHTEWVTAVAFSPDGTRLASGSADKTVRLWDVATGREIGSPLTGHLSNVTAVAFSPDGSTLASVSYDNTVRLWDIATQSQIGDPLSFAAAGALGVDSVAFSPDGTTLAAGGADATLKLWDVSYLRNTAHYLCALVRRSLTSVEWMTFVGPGPAYQNVCP